MFLENTKKLVKIFDQVYVSSDSQSMLDQAKAVGAIPIWRPKKLCGDCPNIPVYQHALTKMADGVQGIVAVQANSPTIEPNLIVLAKKVLETGANEVMTCHPNYSIYGSIWGLAVSKLLNYKDHYHPHPDVLIMDQSIDVHTWDDYEEILKWQ